MSTAQKSASFPSGAEIDQRLRAAVVEAENARFVEAWLGWRGPGRLVPNLGALELAALGDLADSVMLFAMEGPDRIRLERAGARLQSIAGFDATGRTIVELTPPGQLPLRAYRMRMMASWPCAGAMITLDRQTVGHGIVFEVVTFPLGADEPGQPRRLISKVTAMGGAYEPPAPGRPALMPMVDKFAFLDLGAGTPERTAP
jgi:hypothetical protein